MKILFAALGYKPAYRIGGPIHSVSASAEQLVRAGHQVVVVTTDCNLDQRLDVPLNQPVDVDGVEVWYFERQEPLQRYLKFLPYFSRSVGYLYAPQMAERLETLVADADVVHTQNPFIYPTFAAARAAARLGKPLVYQQRGALGRQHLRFRALKKKLYIRAVEQRIMRQARSLIALTADEQASYRALGVQRPCHVIPNGVTVQDYQGTKNVGFAREWGISDDDQVILFLGRLHPTKGVDLLLQAFQSVARKCPRAQMVMAGPDEWGLSERFRTEMRRTGLGHRVHFPGMVTGALKQALLARADLFCLPSHAEGFSMAVLEALASGTPVVLTPGCHFGEVVEAGVGRVVAGRAEPLAETLTELLQQEDVLCAMSSRTVAFVTQHYSWERVTDRLIGVYHEVLGITAGTTRSKHAA